MRRYISHVPLTLAISPLGGGGRYSIFDGWQLLLTTSRFPFVPSIESRSYCQNTPSISADVRDELQQYMSSIAHVHAHPDILQSFRHLLDAPCCEVRLETRDDGKSRRHVMNAGRLFRSKKLRHDKEVVPTSSQSTICLWSTQVLRHFNALHHGVKRANNIFQKQQSVNHSSVAKKCTHKWISIDPFSTIHPPKLQRLEI